MSIFPEEDKEGLLTFKNLDDIDFVIDSLEEYKAKIKKENIKPPYQFQFKTFIEEDKMWDLI